MPCSVHVQQDIICIILSSESRRGELSEQRQDVINYRLLGGGVPGSSPVAFLFAPSPMTTFVLSPGTGVVSFDVSTSAITDEIREKPGRGAGEPLLPDAPGAGLALLGNGAGSVIKPVESS